MESMPSQSQPVMIGELLLLPFMPMLLTPVSTNHSPGWHVADSGKLIGQITIPLALATVGGSIGFQPTAQLAHQILGQPNAQELAHIVAAVGLAQNFAALRALVTEGIQEGHMSLQARSLAISAGATGDHIQYVADQLAQAPKMNLDTAKQILSDLKQ